MIEQKIEIRDGKKYLAYYEGDVQVAPAELVIEVPPVEPPEPVKFNLHKAIIDKLIPPNSRELNPDFITAVSTWASTDAQALWLLNLGDVEWSDSRLDLAISAVNATQLEEGLKAQIVSIIESIKESL